MSVAKKRRPAKFTPTTATSRQTARPKPDRTRIVWLTALVGGAVLVGVVLLFIGFGADTAARGYSCGEVLQSPADASSTEGFVTSSMPSSHVTPGARISYDFCPPTSGRHYNAAGRGPLRPGFYGPNDAAGPGGWVHNLEHGYVVALYRCPEDECPPTAELDALRAFAANGPPTQAAAACGYRSKVLAARFDDMAKAYALVAWDRALLLDVFDTEAALGFASRWIDQTAPEPNAC